MSMRHVLLLSLLLVAAGCGDDDSDGAQAPSPTSVPTTSVPTTTTTTTTTSPASSSTSTSVPVDVEVRDTTPPLEARNLTCGPGAGSGEILLEFDAPADPDDVAVVRVYYQEGTGGFGSIGDYPVAGGAVGTDVAAGTRWAVTAVGVPASTPMELGIALLDAQGNETGFTPIDAYLAFAGAECETGPPAAPDIIEIRPGAGSLEVDVVVTPNATDVIDYLVEADSGEGFVPLEVIVTQPAATAPDVVVVAVGLDRTVDATVRVRAVDAHGFLSAPSDRVCGPLVAGSVC